MANKEKYLEVKDLSLGFMVDKKMVKVIDRVNFSVNKEEIVGLVGESGCGKSVTALTLMQLLPKNGVITGGEVVFDNENLLEFEEKKMKTYRGKEIAMIFQEPMTSLNPVYTIGDQISEMVMLHSAMNKKEAMKVAISKLEMVSMPSPEKVVKQYPHQLSGGMRQRVMIAMAMACDPRVLIADEPTTALDVTVQAQILDLIRDLKNKTKSSIVLITHDLGVVAEMCDHVVVMYAGRIVEKADILALFQNPKHPYTIGLMKSLPVLNETRERLYTIEGNVPRPEDFIEGCRFSSRCEHVMEICKKKNPEFTKMSDSHDVRCWLYQDENGGEA